MTINHQLTTINQTMNELTHTDPEGRARMVDVGQKDVQRREAKASGFISLSENTIGLIRKNLMKKGDVLTVAAKQTASLIPLAHNIVLDKAGVIASIETGGISVTSEVHCTGKTGVEMEALMAVSMALLAIYDMCKAVDTGMVIGQIRLIEKIKKDITV
jgi:cyclic pyranopterin phosphate synthase